MAILPREAELEKQSTAEGNETGANRMIRIGSMNTLVDSRDLYEGSSLVLRRGQTN